MGAYHQTIVVKLPGKVRTPELMESDWNCPSQFGYVLTEDKDLGTYSIVKSSTISSELEKIHEFIETKKSISCKDENDKKSHITILFYGSQNKCLSFLDQIHTVNGKNTSSLTKKDSSTESQASSEKDHDVVDLTISPKKHKRIKTDPDNNSDFNSDTLSGANLTIQGILAIVDKVEKSINNIQQILVNIHEEIKIANEAKEKVSTSSYKDDEAFSVKNDRIAVKELAIRFEKLLLTKRSSKEWKESVKSISIQGVNNKQEKEIKRLLLFGTDHAGSFPRSLSRQLFGEERMRETLLGDDGFFLKGLKQTDRNQVFTVEEELKLINILKIIDCDFFSSRDVYKDLVRYKINSFGRDLKKDEGAATSTPKKITKKFVQSYSIASYFKKIQIPGDGKNLSTQDPIPSTSAVETQKDLEVSEKDDSESVATEYSDAQDPIQSTSAAETQ